ncbi:hypothetical protein CELL_01979 [Cellulomonas sp. T2.31MG-18]|uniref:hypothetical protein n=1 Tax=Cellulomonas sp. T2.31MG-18 TaxID=3157619 RepID=UPI0035EFA86B
MNPFDELPCEGSSAQEGASLTARVGATFDRWPAITWPLLNLEIGASHVTLAARRGFSALVCRVVGLTYVPGLEHRKVLWIARRTDVTIIKRRSASVDVRRASDGAVLRIDADRPDIKRRSAD